MQKSFLNVTLILTKYLYLVKFKKKGVQKLDTFSIFIDDFYLKSANCVATSAHVHDANTDLSAPTVLFFNVTDEA
jgi:hypothetical protein